jgi:hypothetical protein
MKETGPTNAEGVKRKNKKKKKKNKNKNKNEVGAKSATSSNNTSMSSAPSSISSSSPVGNVVLSSSPVSSFIHSPSSSAPPKLNILPSPDKTANHSNNSISHHSYNNVYKFQPRSLTALPKHQVNASIINFPSFLIFISFHSPRILPNLSHNHIKPSLQWHLHNLFRSHSHHHTHMHLCFNLTLIIFLISMHKCSATYIQSFTTLFSTLRNPNIMGWSFEKRHRT